MTSMRTFPEFTAFIILQKLNHFRKKIKQSIRIRIRKDEYSMIYETVFGENDVVNVSSGGLCGFSFNQQTVDDYLFVEEFINESLSSCSSKQTGPNTRHHQLLTLSFYIEIVQT